MADTAASPQAAAATGMPTGTYDEALAARLRQLWQHGNWAEIVAVPLDEIERHPERHRLALMLAAAHQALGNEAQTRSSARLARQWGVDEGLMARVLLAGVHNTLARACAATGKHRERALHHFSEAVAPGASRRARGMAAQSRAQAQLTQIGLAQEFPRLFGRQAALSTPSLPLAPTPFKELADQLKRQDAQLTQRFNDQVKQFAGLRERLEHSMKKELGNTVKQLEAHAALQRYLGEGQTVPDLHGWPISPDFGLLLVSMVENEDFDLIIEFGSGSSTLLMAVALERKAAERASRGKAPTRLVALEHLSQYHAQTASLLRNARLGSRVDLVLAPIGPYRVPSGETFQYYTATAELERVRTELPAAHELKVLLMVDGPPGDTGPLARYPAVPLAMQYFGGARFTVLLDDYFRDDEKKIARRWQDELVAAGLQVEVLVKPLEKEACLLSF